MLFVCASIVASGTRKHETEIGRSDSHCVDRRGAGSSRYSRGRRLQIMGKHRCKYNEEPGQVMTNVRKQFKLSAAD